MNLTMIDYQFSSILAIFVYSISLAWMYLCIFCTFGIQYDTF